MKMADTEKEFDFFSFLENDSFTEDVSEEKKESVVEQDASVIEDIPVVDETPVVEKKEEQPIQMDEIKVKEPEIEPEPTPITIVEKENENKKDAPVVVEEPKSEKKTKKSKTKSEPTPEPPPTFQHTDVKLNLESVNFKNTTEKFVPSVSEDGDEWETIKAEIQKDLTKLDLGDNELEPGAIRVKIKEIVALYNKVKDLEAEYIPLLDTVQDIINRMKVTNSVGTNPESRKKNGLESCETFKIQGLRGTVNLYDYEIIIRYRKEYLASALDRIRNAKDCLDLYVRSYFAEKK